MLPVYKGQSPQLNLRRYFADLIAILSNRFRLCPAARHLAVYLLDLFMDRYDISVQQLHMVALSCLLLSSKLLTIFVFGLLYWWGHYYDHTIPGMFVMKVTHDSKPCLEKMYVL